MHTLALGGWRSISVDPTPRVSVFSSCLDTRVSLQTTVGLTAAINLSLLPDPELQSEEILSEQIFKQNSLHCTGSLKKSFPSVCSGVKRNAPNKHTL